MVGSSHFNRKKDDPMLDSLVSSLITWFNSWKTSPIEPMELLAWEKSAIFQLPSQRSDRLSEAIVGAYLQNLQQQGINSERQGIWIQSDWVTPISNRGKTPLPAASLTKIATTLASLHKWGAKHQFETNIYVTGEIVAGVVAGDLIVEGSGDPFLVWEEAIAIGNTLSQLGINEVRGNLLITDKFYMNYRDRALDSGELFKQALDRQLWQSEVTKQHLQMPVGTKQPEVAIAGEVKAIAKVPANTRLLISHQSLPLAQILRQMNIYSNNKMAQILADLLGGAAAVARSSANAGFEPTEIELVNGSGLSEDNRISPHAVCQMLIAIDRLLVEDGMTAADLFPTAGKDLVGTVQGRGLPAGTTIKTGTLDNVSALAGVIPTRDRGNVCFSIINYGRQTDYFRQQQDILVARLAQTWQLVPNNFDLATENWYLGDPQRNQINRN